MGDLCDDVGEICQMTHGGAFACLKKPSHCVLACQGGLECPVGMECAGDLVCQYPDN